MEKVNTGNPAPAPSLPLKRRSSNNQAKVPVTPSTINNNNLAAVATLPTPRRTKSKTRRAASGEQPKVDVAVGSGQSKISTDPSSSSSSPSTPGPTNEGPTHTARRSRSRIRSNASEAPLEQTLDLIVLEAPKLTPQAQSRSKPNLTIGATTQDQENVVPEQTQRPSTPEPALTSPPKNISSKHAVGRHVSRSQMGTLANLVLSNASPSAPVRIPSSRTVGGGGSKTFAHHRSMVSFNSRNGVNLGVSPTHRAFVEKAIRDHKIFALGGVYPAIRNALKKRGWVEKALNTTVSTCMRTIIQTNLTREVDTKPLDDETEAAYTQRVLTNYPPDFIWVIRRDNISWNQLDKLQQINRFPKAYFTTKVGIAACLQSMHWFNESGVAETYFPRCYRLCIDEEKQAFVDDFRLTACIGLLRWVIQSYEREGDRGIFDASSKVSCLSVDFAVRQLNNYVRMRRHEDIDWLMPPAFMLQHWDVFINQYYSVVHQRLKLGPKDAMDGSRAKYDLAKKALQRIAPYWSQLHVDGIMNIWICKPGARSRGKGITIMNKIENIMDLLNQSNYRESNWVVQKYIEKPLLIYKTKFDMRQWFVVTDWQPLTIWFAKESYVRFCTKPFTLEDFHESVHLCNNAIQCKYQNANERDNALPDENMWDCYTFQAYLKTIGKMEYWDKIIYPGMKQSIIGVMLASQESVEPKRNCFELYGADFMLTDDYRPWLIEINSCPCMSASTSVTARMCAQCLEDTIKLVIDRKVDKNCDTGMFELIYRQNPNSLNTMQFGGVDLMLQGKRMSKDVDWPGIMTKYNSKRGPPVQSPYARNAQPQVLNSANALTFMDLVQKLKLDTLPPAIMNAQNGQQQRQAIENAIDKKKQPVAVAGTGIEDIGNIGKLGNSANYGNNILNVKKIIPGIPDPAFTYNGVAYNIRSADIPNPLYAQISNKAHLFNNTINGNTMFGTVGKALKDTPLSVLMNHTQPTALTMADLLRDQAENPLETAMDLLATSTKARTKGFASALPPGYTHVFPTKKRSTRKTNKSARTPKVIYAEAPSTAVALYNPGKRKHWKNVYYYNSKNLPISSSPDSNSNEPVPSNNPIPDPDLPSHHPTSRPCSESEGNTQGRSDGHSSTCHGSEHQLEVRCPGPVQVLDSPETSPAYEPPPPIQYSSLTKKVRPKTINGTKRSSTMDSPLLPIPNSELNQPNYTSTGMPEDEVDSSTGLDSTVLDPNPNPLPLPSSNSQEPEPESKQRQAHQCYRVALEHPNHLLHQHLSRRTSQTFPLKTVNLPY